MSDYMFVLDSHLDAGQNNAVTAIQKIATEAGMNVWLVGGAMRDMLRGAPIRDLDFTVERDALKAGKALAHALGGEVVAEDPFKRGVELELNARLATEAAANNAVFVNTYADSIGHDACQAPGTKWVEGLIPTSPAAPFHPNQLGEDHMADQVIAAIR